MVFIPVSAAWLCKRCFYNNGDPNTPNPPRTPPPFWIKKWSWEWKDNFEDGDIDDTWEGWDLTPGSVQSCQVNGKTHKYATSVLWENAQYLKEITMEMDFLFKTAWINAWNGSNVFCSIGFRKTSNRIDKIYLQERILQDTKVLQLRFLSGTNTGYQEVLDYTDEDDEKWLVLGTVKIQANYITKKAKISGLISGEIDINYETTNSYKTKVAGASPTHAYAGGTKSFGIAMDKFSTAAKIP